MALETLKEEARKSVLSYDAKGAVAVANKAIEEKVDLVSMIQDGFTKGVSEVGELYEAKKVFLPHMMAAAAAMNAAMEILTPEIEKQGGKTSEGLGTFLICSIEGDIHSIGKDIVAIMLKVAGFNVINLGRDVALTEIVKACGNGKPIGVGTSALMTSTMVNQKTLEGMLVKANLKKNLITNVGGAPVTQQWADEIGAGLYTENASDAVAKLTAAVKAK